MYIIYIYLSFGVSLLNPLFMVSFSTISELFCYELLEKFVILSVAFDVF